MKKTNVSLLLLISIFPTGCGTIVSQFVPTVNHGNYLRGTQFDASIVMEPLRNDPADIPLVVSKIWFFLDLPLSFVVDLFLSPFIFLANWPG